MRFHPRLPRPCGRSDRCIASACLAMALALGLGCRQAGSAPDSKASGRSTGAARALQVRTAAVVVQDVTYRVKAVGSLGAEELVQVTAEVEGAVSEVRFNEGDRVTPDTVLARIDPERYRLEAERAEGVYRRAISEQNRAAGELGRREELGKEQLVAAEELTRARGESTRMQADAATAKAALDIALQNKTRSSVRPPRRGTINSKTVETGQFVRAGTVLATLVDTSRLRLRFNVSEGESLRVRPGDVVRFRVSALGERDFDARVYHVSDIADPTTRQVEVLAWVRNPGELKPGFFAEVTLATESHKGATVVPEGAVQASEKGFVVYAVQDGKAHLRPVQIGLRVESGVVEILSGLEGGETVVVAGSDRLADGMPVQESATSPTKAAQ